jgi:hypothetical protein
MHTVLDILQKTTDFFSGKGVESARLNAELIVGHALGLKRMQLYLQFERLLTELELERIRPLVRRRGQREPLAYVLGTAEFCGLTLKADRRALVPRPETERLVELLQERCTPAPARVLDLGTGSGCIALALAAAWPGAEVVAVDASEGRWRSPREWRIDRAGRARAVAEVRLVFGAAGGRAFRSHCFQSAVPDGGGIGGGGARGAHVRAGIGAHGGGGRDGGFAEDHRGCAAFSGAGRMAGDGDGDRAHAGFGGSGQGGDCTMAIREGFG